MTHALTQAPDIRAPELFRHFHLAAACGRRLADKLRARDFLNAKVRLSTLDMALCLTRAWTAGDDVVRAQPQAFDIVAIGLRARSSFRFAMAALPPAQRRAAETVYAYCRVIDDIADGDMSANAKLHLLAAWRAALADWRSGALETRFAEAMAADPILAGLPPDAFERLLDGMIADAAAPPAIHTLSDLSAYCGLVSGAGG